MGENGEMFGRKPLQETESVSPKHKISDVINGVLYLDEKVLQEVLKSGIKFSSLANENPNLEDTPVALVGVIGPGGSGKSFMTNLLISYFEREGDGGWFIELIKKDKEFFKGFHFGSVESSSLLGGGSGISLWPCAYLVRKEDWSKLLVWILHFQCSGEDKAEEELFTKFLIASCSTILEIVWMNNEVKFPQLRRILTSSYQVRPKDNDPKQFFHISEICNNFTILNRSASSAKMRKPLVGDDAIKEAMKLMYSKDMTLFTGLGRSLSVVHLNDSPQPLHDYQGRLSQELLQAVPLKLVVGSITSDPCPKLFSETADVVLRLRDMRHFFASYLNKVNGLQAAMATLVMKPLSKVVVVPLALTQTKVSPDEIPDITFASGNASNSSNSRGGGTQAQHVLETCIDDDPLQGPQTVPEPSVDEPTPMEVDDGEVDAAAQQVQLEKNTEGTHSRNANQQEVHVTMSDTPKVHYVPSEEEESKKKLALEQEQKRRRDEYVSSAKMKIKEELETLTQRWVRETMTPKNIENFEGLHDKAVINVLESLRADEIRKLGFSWDSFCDIVKFQSEQERLPWLRQLFKELVKLNRELKQVFAVHGYFSTEAEVADAGRTKFLSMVDEFKNKQSLHFDEIQADVFSQGIERLQNLFENYNAAVSTKEHLLMSNQAEKLKRRYDREMRRYLDEILLFPKQDLKKIHTKLMEKLLERFHASFTFSTEAPGPVLLKAKCLREELKSLYSNWVELNEQSLWRLLNAVKHLISQHKADYDLRMAEVTRNYPDGCDPEEFTRIHERNLKEVVHNMKRNIMEEVRTDEPTEGHCISLRNCINIYWEYLKRSNAVKPLISQHKAEYDLRMAEVTRKYPNGHDPEEFTRIHEQNAGELVCKLEQKIREEVKKRMDEDEMEGYCLSLKNRINISWEDLERANWEKLERKRQRDEEEMKKREDGKLKNTHQKSIFGDRATPFSPRGNDGPGSHQYSKITKRSKVPLIFHFKGEAVIMGHSKEGKFELLRNEWGEPTTPMLIARKDGVTLVHGAEAEALLSRDTNAKRWKIVKTLISGEEPWKEDVNFWTSGIHQQTITINFEFLLGFLLRKLKGHAEKSQREIFPEAVISVPFWMSSSQRIQIKDGARFAGFESVYLVNSVSAAAYYFAVEHLKLETNFLVMSETAKKLDGYIFNYSSGVVTMKAHYGEEKNFIPTDGDNAVKTFGKSVAEAIRTKSSKGHSVCNEVCEIFESARNQRIITDSFISYVSEEWKEPLEKACEERHLNLWSPSGNRKMEDWILDGVAMLSSEPTWIAERVKDLMGCDLLRAPTHKRSEPVVVVKGSRTLPTKQSTTLQQNEESAYFYQVVNGSKVSVLRFTANHTLPSSQSITLNFEVSSEGIIRLSSDVKCDSGDGRVELVTADMSQVWSPNLDEGEIEAMRFQLNEFFEGSNNKVEKEDKELTKEKQLLQEKINDMEGKLERGELDISTETRQAIIEVKIAKAKGLLTKKEGCSLEEVRGEIESLEKASLRFARRR